MVILLELIAYQNNPEHIPSIDLSDNYVPKCEEFKPFTSANSPLLTNFIFLPSLHPGVTCFVYPITINNTPKINNNKEIDIIFIIIYFYYLNKIKYFYYTMEPIFDNICIHCNEMIHSLNEENNDYYNYIDELKNDIQKLKIENNSYESLLINIIFFIGNNYINIAEDFLHFYYDENLDIQKELFKKSIDTINTTVEKISYNKYVNDINFTMIIDIFHNDNQNFTYKEFVISENYNSLGINFNIKDFVNSINLTNNFSEIYESIIDIKEFNYEEFVFSDEHKCFESIDKLNNDLDIIQKNIKELEFHKKNLIKENNNYKNVIKNVIIGEIILNRKYFPLKKEKYFIKTIWGRKHYINQIKLIHKCIREISDDNFLNIKYSIYENVYDFGWEI